MICEIINLAVSTKTFFQASHFTQISRVCKNVFVLFRLQTTGFESYMAKNILQPVWTKPASKFDLLFVVVVFWSYQRLCKYLYGTWHFAVWEQVGLWSVLSSQVFYSTAVEYDSADGAQIAPPEWSLWFGFGYRPLVSLKNTTGLYSRTSRWNDSRSRASQQRPAGVKLSPDQIIKLLMIATPIKSHLALG